MTNNVLVFPLTHQLMHTLNKPLPSQHKAIRTILDVKTSFHSISSIISIAEILLPVIESDGTIRTVSEVTSVSPASMVENRTSQFRKSLFTQAPKVTYHTRIQPRNTTSRRSL